MTNSARVIGPSIINLVISKNIMALLISTVIDGSIDSRYIIRLHVLLFKFWSSSIVSGISKSFTLMLSLRYSNISKKSWFIASTLTLSIPLNFYTFCIQRCSSSPSRMSFHDGIASLFLYFSCAQRYPYSPISLSSSMIVKSKQSLSEKPGRRRSLSNERDNLHMSLIPSTTIKLVSRSSWAFKVVRLS